MKNEATNKEAIEEKKETEGNINNKRYIAIIISLLLLCILLTLSRVLLAGKAMSENKKKDDYIKRYAFVIENISDEYMLKVYEAAKEKAKQDGIYVELIGEKLRGNYSLLDYLSIAIASKPDGIILEGNDSLEMRRMIKQADDEGIPVVCVMSDSISSKRKSFIGPNYYDLGKLYGSEIYDINRSKDQKCVIKMLGRDTMPENNKNNIFQGTQMQINSIAGDYQLDILTVSSESVLAMEEDIRTLIYNDEDETNIYISLDPEITKYVYQALIDYNKMSKVDFIGYYTTNNVLQGIKNGTLDSTITLEPAALGITSVDAISEYLQNGFVSFYLPIETKLISKENIDEYLKDAE